MSLEKKVEQSKWDTGKVDARLGQPLYLSVGKYLVKSYSVLSTESIMSIAHRKADVTSVGPLSDRTQPQNHSDTPIPLFALTRG